jgi:hypothetical protein
MTVGKKGDMSIPVQDPPTCLPKNDGAIFCNSGRFFCAQPT